MARIRMRIGMCLLFSLVFFIGIDLLSGIENARKQEILEVDTLVIIGATGNLAKRKIWPSIKELLVKNTLDLSSMYIYAATRDTEHLIKTQLEAVFTDLPCLYRWRLSTDECRNIDTHIANHVKVVQLKSSENFSMLNELIHKQLLKENCLERSRIFYLAIPPFAYSEATKNIDKYARPKKAFLRIAIEKPFGEDSDSAEVLANDLRAHLADNEIFLIDHYLHKPGVKQILKFMSLNQDKLFSVWNTGSISYVEVIAKEQVGVKGRTGFYDHYGVIRDMLQSHLTEIVALLTAGLQTNGIRNSVGNLNKVKREMLSKIYPPFTHSAIVGQYYDYQKHVYEDLELVGKYNTNSTLTPTFAAVLLYIRHSKWFGVPFLVSSGKVLDKKTAFVRIVFKDTSNFWYSDFESHCTRELIFTINHGDSAEYSSISVPILANYDNPFANGEMVVEKSSEPSNNPRDCKVQVFLPNKNDMPANAYTSVIRGLIDGNQDLFVPLENILESWKIWTPLLKELEDTQNHHNMHLYRPNLFDRLNLSVKGTRLLTSASEEIFTSFDAPVINQESIRIAAQNRVGDYIMESSTLTHTAPRSQLVLKITSYIYELALQSIAQRGVFHLALPGGSSSLGVFQSLALDYMHTFPWNSTHIWQTDERCVSLSSVDSNINQLYVYLLDYVAVPHTNIHQMLSGEFKQ